MARSIKAYKDGEVIFREGEAGRDTYAITKGLVALSKDTSHGSVEIEVLTAGSSFGETGVMNGGKRTLTATAVGEVQLMLNAAPADNQHSPESEQKGNPASASLQNISKDSKQMPNSSWWSRLLNGGGRTSSNIEVRIVPFSGVGGAAQAKKIQEALQHCEGIKVKMVSREGPFVQKNGISKNNIGVCVGAARKILSNTSGDVLIWGEIPSISSKPGAPLAGDIRSKPGINSVDNSSPTMHLHFVSHRANDEDAAGSFNGYDILPLPADLDEAWTALLHGVLLSAITPISRAKADNIKLHIESVMELGATVAHHLPREFQAVERASLQICIANSVTVVARYMDESDLFAFSADTYKSALDLVTIEDQPIISGMAHKHRGAVQMLIAEKLGDPTALQEAQLSFQAAIDTIPRRRLPREWAAAQNKLGLVLYKLDYADPSSDVTRLSLAISSFQLAMQVYTRVDAPRRWAEIMNNYAQAAQVMGQQFQDSEMLQKAILACRSSLEVRLRSKTPLLWAATQNTLGSALFLLGKQIDRIDHLEAAIDAFRSAHAVYARKGAHKMAQVIARNLGHVNTLIEERKDSPARNSQWFDESEIADTSSTPSTSSSDDDKQWWKNNVVDVWGPDGEDENYRHPSGDLDIEETPPRKVSNAAE